MIYIPTNPLKKVHATYEDTPAKVAETIQAYDEAGWSLLAMTEHHGYTLVFKRRGC